MKHLITFRIIGFLLLVLVSYNYYACKKVDLERKPLVKVVGVNDITAVSAVISGEVVDVGEDGVTEYGFVYSTGDYPTVADFKVVQSTAIVTGNFTQPVSGLNPETLYKIRGFASIGGDYIYSENIKTFTTLSSFQRPTVLTSNVTGITSNSATCGGEVTDNGGAPVTERGVCWSQQTNPTIDEAKTSDGSGNGVFVSNITSLAANTTYHLRAYATNAAGTSYGSDKTFTTQSGGGALYEWLQYDNGTNYDGIGLNSGGNFDVAIRFRPEQLTNYNGWKIIKFRIFPKLGLPISYSLEIFTGPSGTNLEYLQSLASVTPETWNEVTLDTPHVIDNTTDLWAGYWVQNQPVGSYPAGVDSGPAIANKGDLISTDGGVNWFSLSTENPALNYNWNIQIYITNATGIIKSLSLGKNGIIEHKISEGANPGDFVSEKMLNR